MAQIPVRVNTQTAVFPLLSELQGSTIIDTKGDQTYVPNVNPGDQQVPVDRGIPQIFYCHNVMPSTYGLQSIGFIEKYAGSSANRFQKIKLLVQSTDKIRTFVAWDYQLARTIKVLRPNGTWAVPSGAPTELSKANQLSIATVNGVSYICIALRGVWTYNSSSNSLTPVTLKGLNNSTIRGLLASKGYLIAWSTSGVNWSAVDDPLDFEPSDITGAGGGQIQELKGDIVWCQETAYGFIIYSEANAVSVTWSGNNTYPFNFKEISAAGGLADGDLVSQEATGTQYAYTTNGLQTVFHTGAKTVMPAVTDFLAGKVFEDFNEANNRLVISTIDTPLRKKITLISDRYLVVSYGLYQSRQFTHALIFDIVQGRQGKVKILHNAAFELKNLDPEVGDTPRESIAFLEETGKISVIDFNIRSSSSAGVMILGKYQIVRQYGVLVQTAEVENSAAVDNLDIRLYPLLESKALGANYPHYVLFKDANSLVCSFPTAPAGAKFALLFKGAFNLVSLVLNLTIHGRAR